MRGGRRARLRAAAALCSATAALCLLPAPSATATSTPSPTASVVPPSPTAVLDDEVLTRDSGLVGERAEAVDRLTAELDLLSAQAGAALEEVQRSTLALQEARQTEIDQQLAVDDAESSARASQAAVGRWARYTYLNAGGAGDLSALLGLLKDASPADAAHDLAAYRNVTQVKASDARIAADVQRDAALQAARALAASERAVVAADRSEAARTAGEQLVDRQRAKLAEVTALLQRSQDAARQQELARERARRLAEQLADQQRAAEEATQRLADEQALAAAQGRPPVDDPLTTGAGSCSGEDVSGYPNGAIPLSALCPLWGAPGHHLRADAAAAFDALSQAYAADHGAALCVTDSYRPYADQVRLARTKPTLAARPGRSNHGWGLALDLCGGIQTFGSAGHEWMRFNAPAFGWFHPAWAQAGGSKPEAWHWEFAG
ncbi:MAG TPA: D-alanyl-D-alanine carboxypeptidase family protein [Actinomycetales bacterium]|jgi:hypothetical protein